VRKEFHQCRKYFRSAALDDLVPKCACDQPATFMNSWPEPQVTDGLPANDSLLRDIEELLTRPVGRPSHKPVVWYKGFLYQAASWKTARRVVAKVEFHAGELFPRVGYIVTNLEMPSRAVVRFCNKRGTAEQWIKQGKR